MKLSEFYYELPEGRIAQFPVTPRDHSKLMIVDCSSNAIQHKQFHEIVQFFIPGDVLVVNVTKVFPARLRGKKRSGGKVDVLLLEPVLPSSEKALSPKGSSGIDEGGLLWRSLIRGARKATDLLFPEELRAAMETVLPNGEWLLRFSRNSIRDYLDRHGEMPLPPYIKRLAEASDDRDRYQTVFARDEGAVAAPTAGFHFTEDVLHQLEKKGIQRVEITLHVGWGTFRPIRTEKIEEHPMLPEAYTVSLDAASKLSAAKKDGRRIVAVGTTAVRTLETICDDQGTFHAGEGQAKLFIYPGYRFKAVNALVTNFHLPDSTPLLLANAFFWDKSPKTIPSLPPFVLRPAYEAAIQGDYRFYSYGDAMFMQ